MPVVAIIGFLIFSGYLVTRFGNQVLARDSTSWWFILLFLGVGVVSPESYRAISQLLGITLVSNFVFAAMILFLLKVTLEGAIRNTQVLRKLRDVVTTEAADRFANSAKFNGNASRPRVLILLPAYNEEANVEMMAKALNESTVSLGDEWQWTVCFVNDGSQDKTKLKLNSVMKDSFVSHPSNFGVSSVLMTGFKAAEALNCKYVVQCDSDGQHPVNKIVDLLRAADSAGADLTIGSRFANAKEAGSSVYKESTTLLRRLGSQLISLALNAFGRGAVVHDPTSGFRVYSAAAYRFLVRYMPDDYPEPESIALLKMRGLRVQELSISMQHRQGGVSSISGLKSLEFMIKVFTALLSLRLRYAVNAGRIAG